MTSRLSLIIACAILLVSCEDSHPALFHDATEVEVDVKPPASGFPADFRFTLVTDTGASSTAVYGSYLALPSGLTSLSESFVLHRRSDKYRFFIIEEQSPSQTVVWQLPQATPRDPDWTPWQLPTFIENSDRGWWNLVYDRGHEHRSSAVPYDSYRARFRYLPYPNNLRRTVRPPWPTVTPIFSATPAHP